MKSTLFLLGLLVVSMSRIHTANAALVSFDDIATGDSHTTLPNGYGGLQWFNFQAQNGLAHTNLGGYRTGLVSPSNVLFNASGNPSYIHSDVPFSLESAHVTAGSVEGLEVEVQGWLGSTLAYKNTYALSTAGPTFVQFGYGAVDRVTFCPSVCSIFVTDDMVVTTPAPTENQSCTFTLSPGSFAHGPGAETNTVSVTTQGGCAWAVHNPNSWVTILSSLNNSNSGTVSYRVATNPRAQSRSGAINIAGQSFEVSQVAGQPPATHTPVDLGTIVVTKIGHVFRDPPDFPFPFPHIPSSTAEYLIDQQQSSGSDGVLPNLTANWDTNIQFTLTVAAPPAMRFLVEVPSGRTARFGGSMLWEAKWRGGSCPPGPVSVSFEGLEGTPPDFAGSDAVLADAHGFVGFSEITSSRFSENIAFCSVTFTGTVEPQYTGFESLDYVPDNSCSLMIFSQTDDPDSGARVTIVPKPVLPRVEVAEMPANAGPKLMVQGHAARTHVLEASPDLIHWAPISTNVMPSTVCPTCPFVYVQDTALPKPDRRFYRVQELP